MATQSVQDLEKSRQKACQELLLAREALECWPFDRTVVCWAEGGCNAPNRVVAATTRVERPCVGLNLGTSNVVTPRNLH